MLIFELLAQRKNNRFTETKFGISFLSQIHIEFIQVARLGSTTKPKFKAPLHWFTFHLLSHYAFPLELTHARQLIGELLVAAYPENAFLDDQKEASVSMHDHTPHFLLVAILYGYQQNEYFAIF